MLKSAAARTTRMVQAARSGVLNIAEGSQTSGTSKKTALELTNVARASLKELRLDYEDFLRQQGLERWLRQDPGRAELIARRLGNADEVAQWAREAHDGQGGQSRSVRTSAPSTKFMPFAYLEIAANGALALIAVACALLDRQIQAQAALFTQEGGFSEHLCRVRSKTRSR